MLNQKYQMTNESGMSLIEILVVIGIFAILGVITTSALILTLSGSRKAENLVKIRENLNYSLAVVERGLRNANKLIDTCPNTDTTKINYIDQDGTATNFSCGSASGVGFVASGSGMLKLTSDSVNVTSCSFVCSNSTNGSPSSVKINLTGQNVSATGTDNSQVSASTEVFLRNY